MRARANCTHPSIRDHWELRCMSRCPDHMVSLKRDPQCLSHQASLVLIYRSTAVGMKKNVKSGKGPLTPAGLLKLVKLFEETGKLEDQARAGRPYLKEACIAVEMEAIASEAAS
ncbi:hypothetical protein TNCV_1904971 [Trichonephila clavipes]|nr:hypothetical protein TNCV_1904971 [Trichonephila clavipes]